MERVRARIRGIFRPEGDVNVVRVSRRRKMVAVLNKRLPTLRLLLYVIGYLWMLAVPSPQLGRTTYHDENALQPGQVNTYWNWGDVHSADRYLEQLEQLRDKNASSEERSQFLRNEFKKLGIPSATQSYSFSASSGVRNTFLIQTPSNSWKKIAGSNAYALLSSPRISGTEALLISASWLSRTGEGDGTLNLRGVSTVLALAKFLKRYSLWAKDIIFVVNDGYLDGMQAWLSEYHGVSQSNLYAELLELTSGVIWTALNIDYPGHSFSHLGVFFEGVNGRLPNQDLINSFKHIAQTTGGVPVVLYDHMDPRDHPELRHELEIWPAMLPKFFKDIYEVQTYGYHAKNILRHVGYQGRGRPSGVHGLLHKYRIDAITIFAPPATGPHGFHAIGRIIESTLRTMNNLLERLHASFFFYILAGSNAGNSKYPAFSHFLKIGSYLPSAILVSVAIMFGGLRVWTDAGWILETQWDSKQASRSEWRRRRRDVIKALIVMGLTHSLGAALLGVLRSNTFLANQTILSFPVVLVAALLPCLLLLVPYVRHATGEAPLREVLRALNLCFASTFISIVTVLNFSLAALLAIFLGIPLSISSSQRSGVKGIICLFMGCGWILFQGETRKAIWDWNILRVLLAPIVCIVYYPLLLQAALVNLLPVG